MVWARIVMMTVGKPLVALLQGRLSGISWEICRGTLTGLLVP